MTRSELAREQHPLAGDRSLREQLAPTEEPARFASSAPSRLRRLSLSSVESFNLRQSAVQTGWRSSDRGLTRSEPQIDADKEV